MPEIYSLRSRENLNYDHWSSPKSAENVRKQKAELYSTRSTNDKQIPSSDLHKPYTAPIYRSSPESPCRSVLYHLECRPDVRCTCEHRSPSVASSVKRESSSPFQPLHKQKPEMYHSVVGEKRSPEYGRQSPSNTSTNITHSDSPRVTMYMMKGVETDNFSPHYSRTQSPSINPLEKRFPVTFPILDDQDKQDLSTERHYISTKQRNIPANHHYGLSLQSKASESIQRSMNKYRFIGS